MMPEKRTTRVSFSTCFKTLHQIAVHVHKYSHETFGKVKKHTVPFVHFCYLTDIKTKNNTLYL